jgi:hypothetical protein
MAQSYPWALCSLYDASYDSQGYGGGILTLPQTGGPSPRIYYIAQEQDGPIQSQSHVTTDGQSISVLVPSPRGFRGAPSERISIRHLEGYIKARFFMSPFGGMHMKHAVQRGIWIPTQHLLWYQGKPRRTLLELAGRRTLQMQT